MVSGYKDLPPPNCMPLRQRTTAVNKADPVLGKLYAAGSLLRQLFALLAGIPAKCVDKRGGAD